MKKTGLTQSELAAYLGTSQVTVHNWLKKGMPHRITGPCQYAIDLAQAVDWLRQIPRYKAWLGTFAELADSEEAADE